jgi:hypothetical protein
MRGRPQPGPSVHASQGVQGNSTRNGNAGSLPADRPHCSCLLPAEQPERHTPSTQRGHSCPPGPFDSSRCLRCQISAWPDGATGSLRRHEACGEWYPYGQTLPYDARRARGAPRLGYGSPGSDRPPVTVAQFRLAVLCPRRANAPRAAQRLTPPGACSRHGSGLRERCTTCARRHCH